MPIKYIESSKTFVLNTAHTAYLFSVTGEGGLLHLYWGEKLPRFEDYPTAPTNRQHSSFEATLHDLLAEFPTRAGIESTEPCLRATFADGVHDVRLVYQSYEQNGDELAIKLKERHYGLEVTLRYQLYPEYDLLTRQVEIHNNGAEEIRVEEILSGSVPLPYDRGEYRLTHLAGAWAAETLLERTRVTPGRKVIEGRLNYSGHANNPFFALDLVDSEGYGATETRGEVWFGALQWTGNWKIVVEQARAAGKRTRIAAGINDYEFAWQLKAGDTFQTPLLVLGYSGQGFGQMSRNLHRYQQNHVLPTRFAQELRPVLYNSWEAVFFAVSEEAQISLAEKAAKLGAEVFVIDDGWFGERHNDRAALGDWQPNPKKFPNGLTPLIKRVNELGMQFGIWVEPEMVNPDSDLYRAHPDWAYHFANREPVPGRNQYILNLCREDVQEWMFGWLDKLLSGHNISYVKWDYNRAMSEPGWDEAPREQQRETWVRHVQALYSIVDRLRQNHPEVLFEACSGGGGRADMGAISHFDHVWTSDNTDPLDRLPIQQGYSLVYPTKTMYCWVTHTDWNRGNYPLRYRFHSSFLGALGVGTNLNKLTEEELQESAALVAEYKEIRPLVQHGEMYRLSALGEENYLAVEYLAEDKGAGVVFAFSQNFHFWRNPRRLRLQGLESTSLYQLQGDIAEGEPTELSGQALMSRGIMPKLERAISSVCIKLSRK